MLTAAPAASIQIPETCVAVACVEVWWGGGMGKRKQIVDLGFKIKEARRDGGRGDGAGREDWLIADVVQEIRS
ncbi:hypothetical protein SO802_021443 [Lithocarpus litseifolius]|uniref:Uncharacterized protein n=1 Tax=Lithocarpus litseifolius TaxID=425828 RepID=A0AAW2CGV7_9ROSI